MPIVQHAVRGTTALTPVTDPDYHGEATSFDTVAWQSADGGCALGFWDFRGEHEASGISEGTRQIHDLVLDTTMIIVEGELELTVDDDTVTLGAGDIAVYKLHSLRRYRSRDGVKINFLTRLRTDGPTDAFQAYANDDPR